MQQKKSNSSWYAKVLLAQAGSSGSEIARRGTILEKVDWGHAQICDEPRRDFTRGCFASHYQTLRPISLSEEEGEDPLYELRGCKTNSGSHYE